MRQRYDVVIAGGGIIGSACAYFLAENSEFDGTVAVIEPDPSYQRSATTLSASSIRQQFSTPVNIAISQFGIAFLRDVASLLAINDERPNIGLTASTYLYLATAAGSSRLQSNNELQRANGVAAELLCCDDLAQRFRWLNTEDIDCASVTGDGEGWFDSYQLLMALRKKACAGEARDNNKAQVSKVDYIKARVENVQLDSRQQLSGVTLSNGTVLQCGQFVNATGTYSRTLAAQAGIDLPVFPRKRCVFVFACKQTIDDCPLVVDPSGLWFRPEGKQFICSLPPQPDEDVALDDFSVDHSLFEEKIWPLLANRVPDFSEIKVTGYWAGHYDYNSFDQNAIIGPHPQVDNFFLASGFSGHGLQQAPAVGRGISEMIVYGNYRSLDLSPLSYRRIIENRPLIEHNII